MTIRTSFRTPFVSPRARPLLPRTLGGVSDAADLAHLEEQLGRTPYPPARVACRCAAGRPVVVEQPPATPDGTPFPTAFWLCCPGLIHAVAVLEAAGGVRALEERIAADADLAAAFDEAQARHGALRDGLGIGGVRNPRAVKCLHAHVAFALGAPPYPIGEALLAEAGGVPAACCMEGR
jgi:uncharacterized protein